MKVVWQTIGVVMLLAVSVSGASATCLSIERGSGVSFWVNSCPVHVNVNWSDQGSCRNWSCSDGVNANSRETESFIGRVDWCECQGLSCYAHGPC
jgi:hypothetical protein